MAKYKKWNYDTRKYEPFEVPDGVKLSTYEKDLNAKINCCQCFKEITYGEGYTSLEVHTSVGFGYIVCGNCYDDELIRRIRGDGNELARRKKGR